ncbi:TetR/AcrR family transcriptional regulator, partial [Streptomyces sp. SID7982]|nr:TetR/AcrR family transcriptional regulator [Streptomyces sp. SID7982]
METRKKGPSGRPRGFDADQALERAMLVFWEHGYEGASLAALTDAMGISATSMYAAFGNKQELFRKAMERYATGPSDYLVRALEQPTARGVATEILAGTIRTTTRPSGPQGCLGVQGALAASDSGRE